MKLGLEGKKVFISGSTQGIGLKTAEGFLEEGALVMLNGRCTEKLELVKGALLRQYPDRVFSSCADLSMESGTKQVAADIAHSFSGLDIYIANLGSGKPFAKDYLEVAEWERFYRINMLSHVALLNRLYPLLKQGIGANIVFISSIVARETASAPYGYAAAKGAVLALNKYLAKDWAQDGIRVNCVLPGNIYFDGGRWQELERLDEEGTYAYIRSKVPMGRFGRPEEIADAILFLASKRASFITGAAFVVDGGQTSCI